MGNIFSNNFFLWRYLENKNLFEQNADDNYHKKNIRQIIY